MEMSKKRLADYGLQSERVLWPTRARALRAGARRPRAAVGLTTVEKAVAWSQASSVWPDTFGLACCAIEMMSIVSARYDVARFGAEVFRSSPRQADLLIVSGRVAHKMAAPLRQIYDQMLEPKWVIAMGACASSGGMFNNYTILQGVDKVVPVDIHVPGCPPRPEALVEGIIRLQEKIKAGVPPAYEIRDVDLMPRKMLRTFRGLVCPSLRSGEFN
jgi:NADH-quinone oxidoreductase subunit B